MDQNRLQCKSGGTDVDIFILDTGRKGRRGVRERGREGGREEERGDEDENIKRGSG